MTEHENSTIFTNHNQLRTPQKKLQKNHRHSFLILGCMKKIFHNFQWNPLSKTRKRADQTLKTSSYEIYRCVSLAIVTNCESVLEVLKKRSNFVEIPKK